MKNKIYTHREYIFPVLIILALTTCMGTVGYMQDKARFTETQKPTESKNITLRADDQEVFGNIFKQADYWTAQKQLAETKLEVVTKDFRLALRDMQDKYNCPKCELDTKKMELIKPKEVEEGKKP